MKQSIILLLSGLFLLALGIYIATEATVAGIFVMLGGVLVIVSATYQLVKDVQAKKVE